MTNKTTKKSSDVVTHGGISLEKNPITSNFVPKIASAFIDHSGMMKTLALGVRENLAVLIIGESGVGKTSAIRHLAHETNNGLRRVNLNGGTTADELVGRMLINEKGTYWVDGILTEAMRNGDWIVFDEINAALPEVLFVLQSVLDDDAFIVLTEKSDKEIVHKHPNTRIFATCNPPDYAGTKEMNPALLSRFAICINAEYPTPKVEIEIIKHHLGSAIAESEMAEKLVGMANETRKAKENGKTDYAINPRDVLNVLRLTKEMSPIDALTHAFSNKLDPDDNGALKTMAKLHLPSKKKNIVEKVKITTEEDFKIGNSYIIEKEIAGIYTGITEKKEDFDVMIKKNLKDIIVGTSTEGSIKNDEFNIIGTFYADNEEETMSTKNETNQGPKIGSAIQFIEGNNKGKFAVMMHTNDYNPEVLVEILSNTSEIK